MTSDPTPGHSHPARRGPTLDFEEEARRSGYRRIAGVDEAGRGPIAGPVAAAAVILPQDSSPDWLQRVNDSKELTAKARESLATLILGQCVVGAAMVPAHEIDHLGIVPATRLAMLRALDSLLVPPDYVLVDGRPILDDSFNNRPIVDGDALSLSIACASIVAKVLRDRVMDRLETQFPGYGLANNKGYATREHLAAIERLGPTLVHRRTFAPLKHNNPREASDG